MGGIFGGGGGGGGTSKTTSETSYPPEFRPLATSAVSQIQGLQGALPLAQFGAYQPAGVAGLSPVEQFAISDLVSRAPYLPTGLEGILALPDTLGASQTSLVGGGKRTKASQESLRWLQRFLGTGEMTQPAEPLAVFPTLTRFPMPETAFPGLTKATLEAARPGLLAPAPMLQPSPMPMTLPAPVATAPVNMDAAIAEAVAKAMANPPLPPETQQLMDYYIARGMPPDRARLQAVAETAGPGGGRPFNESPGGGE